MHTGRKLGDNADAPKRSRAYANGTPVLCNEHPLNHGSDTTCPSLSLSLSLSSAPPLLGSLNKTHNGNQPTLKTLPAQLALPRSCFFFCKSSQVKSSQVNSSRCGDYTRFEPRTDPNPLQPPPGAARTPWSTSKVHGENDFSLSVLLLLLFLRKTPPRSRTPPCRPGPPPRRHSRRGRTEARRPSSAPPLHRPTPPERCPRRRSPLAAIATAASCTARRVSR